MSISPFWLNYLTQDLSVRNTTTGVTSNLACVLYHTLHHRFKFGKDRINTVYCRYNGGFF